MFLALGSRGSFSLATFLHFSLFVLTIHGKDEIVFQEEDSSVDSKFFQTSAMSKVNKYFSVKFILVW